MTWGRSSKCSEFFVCDPTPQRDLVQIAEMGQAVAAGMALMVRTAALEQRSEGGDEIERSQSDGEGL